MFGFVTQVSHMSFVTRRNSGARGPKPPTPPSSYSPATTGWSKTKNTPSSVFPNFRCLPIVVDSLHLGFLSSLRCTVPPLPSALPALTGHPALRPIRGEQKSVPTNQRRACTELTIVLGSGCIPSKVDLFEHHPITWPHEPREQGVGQVFLNIFHLLGERIKRRAGLMTQGFVFRGQPPPPQINPTDCFPTCAALTTSPQQRINYQNPGSPF